MTPDLDRKRISRKKMAYQLKFLIQLGCSFQAITTSASLHTMKTSDTKRYSFGILVGLVLKHAIKACLEI